MKNLQSVLVEEGLVNTASKSEIAKALDNFGKSVEDIQKAIRDLNWGEVGDAEENLDSLLKDSVDMLEGLAKRIEGNDKRNLEILVGRIKKFRG